MNHRQLGNSGVRVSVIGLGANRFGSENVPQAEVNRIIDAALDLGINFIDTSGTLLQEPVGVLRRRSLKK
jgi:aryl-alcohol dehydrogenase-like predicted oxidoreductase